jgi:hypothetical protein
MGETLIEMFSPERFNIFWPFILRELKKVPHMWQPWWTEESLYDLTMNGTFQCWAAKADGEIKAIAFSRVNTFPTGNVFYVWLAFGEGFLEYADAFEAAFEQFAIKCGCHMAEVTGRPGWEPMLRKKGFRRTASVLTKQIYGARVN